MRKPRTVVQSNDQRSPTVVEVAKKVGCSTATVSRALSPDSRVHPELRERVLKAVRELGYVPNASARALRSARSRLIGSVVPTLNNAIYAQMLEGLEAGISASGASVLHHATGYDLTRELEQVRGLVEKGVDGVVLVGALHRPETLQCLRDRNIRFLVTYALSAAPDVPCVGFDNHRGGAMAAQYLLDLGHTQLAVICGVTRENDRASERLEGFLATAERSGIRRADVAVSQVRYEFSRSREAMRTILQQKPQVTGVFCASDVLAVGAMRGCVDVGLRIPQDISIVGYDNLDIAEYLTPALTTIEVPARLMGERAAEFFVAGSDMTGDYRIELDTHLVVRGTVAPPRREKLAASSLGRSPHMGQAAGS